MTASDQARLREMLLSLYELVRHLEKTGRYQQFAATALVDNKGERSALGRFLSEVLATRKVKLKKAIYEPPIFKRTLILAEWPVQETLQLILAEMVRLSDVDTFGRANVYRLGDRP